LVRPKALFLFLLQWVTLIGPSTKKLKKIKKLKNWAAPPDPQAPKDVSSVHIILYGHVKIVCKHLHSFTWHNTDLH
jgi:hypothetical protein